MNKTLITAVVVLAASFVSGCSMAPVVRQVTMPSGKQGFSISCDSASSLAPCYEEAAKACKGKYTIIDKSESSTPTQYGPLVTRNIMVDCSN